jgi:predicted NBD/HSP70 family sugar kinase
MIQVLKELRRIDPGQSAHPRALSKKANVETLHQVTGLARGTVHNALTRLRPVLHATPHRDTASRGRRGGKPTILYQLSPQAGEALVLDFDHDRVTAWRADSLGNVFALGTERVEVDGDAKKAIEVGAKLLRKHPSTAWQRVVGIGLSIPAPVDPDRHRTLGRVLRSWEDPNLDEILRGHLPTETTGRVIPILADNDANLASLAEYRSREARRSPDERLSNLVLVKTVPGSIGVGAGAIVNGQQLRGRGFAMELGHLRIDTPVRDGANEVKCPHCDRTDCLQARISTDALIGGDPAPAWDDVVGWTRENLLSLHGARDSAAEANDPAEVERLNAKLDALVTADANTQAIVAAGEEMGRALAKVVTLLDPDVIALEGELARAWLDTGAGSMREIVGKPLEETFLACSSLSREEAVLPTLASSSSNCARGAVAAVLDEYLVDFILDRI